MSHKFACTIFAFLLVLLLGVATGLRSAEDLEVTGSENDATVTHSSRDTATVHDYQVTGTSDVLVTVDTSASVVTESGVAKAFSVEVGSKWRLRVDVVPPTVSIESPLTNAVFDEGDDIVLTARPIDADGTIAGVAFVANGTDLGDATDNQDGTWSLTWSGASIDTYNVIAIATDDDGAQEESSAITLKVDGNAIVAADDVYLYDGSSLTVGTAIGLLANDYTNVTGEAPTVKISSIVGPASGQLTPQANGSFTFVAATNPPTGSTSFTYRAEVVCGQETLLSQEVTVHILEIPAQYDAPGLYEEVQGDGSDNPSLPGESLLAKQVSPFCVVVTSEEVTSAKVIVNGVDQGGLIDGKAFVYDVGLDADPSKNTRVTIKLSDQISGDTSTFTGLFRWRLTPIGSDTSDQTLILRVGDAIHCQLAIADPGELDEDDEIRVTPNGGSTTVVSLDDWRRAVVTFDAANSFELQAYDGPGGSASTIGHKLTVTAVADPTTVVDSVKSGTPVDLSDSYPNTVVVTAIDADSLILDRDDLNDTSITATGVKSGRKYFLTQLDVGNQEDYPSYDPVLGVHAIDISGVTVYPIVATKIPNSTEASKVALLPLRIPAEFADGTFTLSIDGTTSVTIGTSTPGQTTYFYKYDLNNEDTWGANSPVDYTTRSALINLMESTDDSPPSGDTWTSSPTGFPIPDADSEDHVDIIIPVYLPSNPGGDSAAIAMEIKNASDVVVMAQSQWLECEFMTIGNTWPTTSGDEAVYGLPVCVQPDVLDQVIINTPSNPTVYSRCNLYRSDPFMVTWSGDQYRFPGRFVIHKRMLYLDRFGGDHDVPPAYGLEGYRLWTEMTECGDEIIMNTNGENNIDQKIQYKTGPDDSVTYQSSTMNRAAIELINSVGELSWSNNPTEANNHGRTLYGIGPRAANDSIAFIDRFPNVPMHVAPTILDTGSISTTFIDDLRSPLIPVYDLVYETPDGRQYLVNRNPVLLHHDHAKGMNGTWQSWDDGPTRGLDNPTAPGGTYYALSGNDGSISSYGTVGCVDNVAAPQWFAQLYDKETALILADDFDEETLGPDAQSIIENHYGEDPNVSTNPGAARWLQYIDHYLRFDENTSSDAAYVKIHIDPTHFHGDPRRCFVFKMPKDPEVHSSDFWSGENPGMDDDFYYMPYPSSYNSVWGYHYPKSEPYTFEDDYDFRNMWEVWEPLYGVNGQASSLLSLDHYENANVYISEYDYISPTVPTIAFFDSNGTALYPLIEQGRYRLAIGYFVPPQAMPGDFGENLPDWWEYTDPEGSYHIVPINDLWAIRLCYFDYILVDVPHDDLGTSARDVAQHYDERNPQKCNPVFFNGMEDRSEDASLSTHVQWAVGGPKWTQLKIERDHCNARLMDTVGTRDCFFSNRYDLSRSITVNEFPTAVDGIQSAYYKTADYPSGTILVSDNAEDTVVITRTLSDVDSGDAAIADTDDDVSVEKYTTVINGMGMPDALTPFYPIIHGYGSVNLANGNFNLNIPVCRFGSPLPGPELSISYNSRSTRNIGLGRGWTHTYDMRMVEVPLGEVNPNTGTFYVSARIVIDGTGKAYAFDANGNPHDDNPSPNSILLDLAPTTSTATTAKWEFRRYDGRRYFFNRECQLIQIQTVQGHTLTVDQANKTVTDDHSNAEYARVLNIDPTSALFGKVVRNVGGSEVTIYNGGTITKDDWNGVGVRDLTAFNCGCSGSWEFSYDGVTGFMIGVKLNGVSIDPDQNTVAMQWTFVAGSDERSVATVKRPLLAGQTTGQESTIAIIYNEGIVHWPATKAEINDDENGKTIYEIDDDYQVWTKRTDAMNLEVSRTLLVHESETIRVLAKEQRGTGSESLVDIFEYDIGVQDKAPTFERRYVLNASVGHTNQANDPVIVTADESIWYPIDTDGSNGDLPGAVLLAEKTVTDIKLKASDTVGTSLTTKYIYHPVGVHNYAGYPAEVVDPKLNRTGFTYTDDGYPEKTIAYDVVLGLDVKTDSTVSGNPASLVWEVVSWSQYGEPTKLVPPEKGTATPVLAEGKYHLADDALGSIYKDGGLGLRSSVVNKLNKTTTYTYDDQGHMLTEDGPGADDTIQYQPDVLGSRRKTIYPKTAVTSGGTLVEKRWYDARGRITRIESPRRKATVIKYEPVTDSGNIIRWKVSECIEESVDPQVLVTLKETITDLIGRTVESSVWRVLETQFTTEGNIDTSVLGTKCTTTYAYDPYTGFPTTVTDPRNTILTYYDRHDLGYWTELQITGASGVAKPYNLSTGEEVGTVSLTRTVNNLGIVLEESDGDGIVQIKPVYDGHLQVESADTITGLHVDLKRNAIGDVLKRSVSGEKMGKRQPLYLRYYSDSTIRETVGPYGLGQRYCPDLDAGTGGIATFTTTMTAVEGDVITLTPIYEKKTTNVNGHINTVETNINCTDPTQVGERYSNDVPRVINPGLGLVPVVADLEENSDPRQQQVGTGGAARNPTCQVVDAWGRVCEMLSTDLKFTKRIFSQTTGECMGVLDNSDDASPTAASVQAQVVLEQDAAGNVLRLRQIDQTEVAYVYDYLNNRVSTSRTIRVNTSTSTQTHSVKMTPGGRELESSTKVGTGKENVTAYSYNTSTGQRIKTETFLRDGTTITDRKTISEVLERLEDGAITKLSKPQEGVVDLRIFDIVGNMMYALSGNGSGSFIDYITSGKLAGLVENKYQLDIATTSDGEPQINAAGLPVIVHARRLQGYTYYDDRRVATIKKADGTEEHIVYDDEHRTVTKDIYVSNIKVKTIETVTDIYGEPCTTTITQVGIGDDAVPGRTGITGNEIVLASSQSQNLDENGGTQSAGSITLSDQTSPRSVAIYLRSKQELTETQDEEDWTTTLLMDPLGRERRKTMPTITLLTSYGSDGLCNERGPAGRLQSFVRDSVTKQVTGINFGSGTSSVMQTTYGFNDNGRINAASISYENSGMQALMGVNLEQDDWGKILGRSRIIGTSSDPYTDETVVRDVLGRIHKIIDDRGTPQVPADDTAKYFYYDTKQRLAAERHVLADGSVLVRCYKYDWIGNRTDRESIVGAATSIHQAWDVDDQSKAVFIIDSVDKLPDWTLINNKLTRSGGSASAPLESRFEWLDGKQPGFMYRLTVSDLDTSSSGVGLSWGTLGQSEHNYQARLASDSTGNLSLDMLCDGAVTASRPIDGATQNLILVVVRLPDGSILAQVENDSYTWGVLTRCNQNATGSAIEATPSLISYGDIELTHLEWDIYDNEDLGQHYRDIYTYAVDEDENNQEVLTNRLIKSFSTGTPDQETSYKHDLLSRQTDVIVTDTRTGVITKKTFTEYDALDRPAEVKTWERHNGELVLVATETFEYNPGTRIRIIRNRVVAGQDDVKWEYGWDGDKLLVEKQYVDNNLESDKAYVYGSGSTPLAYMEYQTNRMIALSSDLLGNTTECIGNIGEISANNIGILQRMQYDAYGVVLGEEAYNPATQALESTVITSGLKYRGQSYDAETKLVYLRNRYYDPALGSFTQVDPARAGNNWFGYAGGDPVNYWDPTGLDRVFQWTYDNGGVGVYWIPEYKDWGTKSKKPIHIGYLSSDGKTVNLLHPFNGASSTALYGSLGDTAKLYMTGDRGSRENIIGAVAAAIRSGGESSDSRAAQESNVQTWQEVHEKQAEVMVMTAAGIEDVGVGVANLVLPEKYEISGSLDEYQDFIVNESPYKGDKSQRIAIAVSEGGGRTLALTGVIGAAKPVLAPLASAALKTTAGAFVMKGLMYGGGIYFGVDAARKGMRSYENFNAGDYYGGTSNAYGSGQSLLFSATMLHAGANIHAPGRLSDWQRLRLFATGRTPVEFGQMNPQNLTRLTMNSKTGNIEYAYIGNDAGKFALIRGAANEIVLPRGYASYRFLAHSHPELVPSTSSTSFDASVSEGTEYVTGQNSGGYIFPGGFLPSP